MAPGTHISASALGLGDGRLQRYCPPLRLLLVPTPTGTLAPSRSVRHPHDRGLHHDAHKGVSRGDAVHLSITVLTCDGAIC
eukprot:scaffold147585_cov33-Tisochrysis_lutea.AAC.3